MDDSREHAIEENVDLFVNRYRPLANNFGFVKGFLSAAVGHAASTSDRTAVCELLLDAAAALDRHEKWHSRHSRPEPWMPIDGEPGTAALSAEEVAGTLSTMHEARPKGSGQSSIPRHCARHLSCWDGMITRPPLQFSGRRRTSFAQLSLTNVCAETAPFLLTCPAVHHGP